MREITREELDKITEANEKVKGTDEYGKYYMPCEFKIKKDGRWKRWILSCWGAPVFRKGTYYLKIIKDNTYIISEEYDDGWGYLEVERYGVTDAVKELLNL